MALVLDFVALFVLGFVLDAIFHTNFTTVSDGGIALAFNGIYSLIPLLYVTLSWIYWDGATIGKKIMKIKIIKTDGHSVDWPTAIVRLVGYLASFIPFALGFLWIIWDRNKQGFHDKIAKTYVIKVE